MCGLPDLFDFRHRCAVAGSLASSDHRIRIKEGKVAGQLIDATITRDRMRAVLDVAVGENLYVLGPEQGSITHRFRRTPFHETLVGDIGIGPLVDADECRSARHSNGESRDRRIGKHVDTERNASRPRDPVSHHAHEGSCLMTDILRLGKGNIAMVFNEKTMHTAFDQSLGIAHADVVDGIHGRATIPRCSGKRWAMHHADQGLVTTKDFLDGVRPIVGYDLHALSSRKFFMRAFVIGNIALDETYSVSALPEAGASIFGRQAFRDLGGKGCNQAIVMARCGLDTTLTAAVGTDDRSATIRARLATEPLTADLIGMDGQTSDLSIIFNTPDGENSIVTTTARAESLTPEDVAGTLGTASPSDLLVVQGNLGETTTRLALSQAKATGMITAFNPSPLQPWFESLWPLTDIAFLNRGEAAALTGDTGSTAIKLLISAGVRQVILTLGGEGSMLGTTNQCLTVPAEKTGVVDTTGAGDCFMAVTLASAALRNVSVDERALRHGAKASALTVSRRGTLSAFPDILELADILSN